MHHDLDVAATRRARPRARTRAQHKARTSAHRCPCGTCGGMARARSGWACGACCVDSSSASLAAAALCRRCAVKARAGGGGGRGRGRGGGGGGGWRGHLRGRLHVRARRYRDGPGARPRAHPLAVGGAPPLPQIPPPSTRPRLVEAALPVIQVCGGEKAALGTGRDRNQPAGGRQQREHRIPRARGGLSPRRGAGKPRARQESLTRAPLVKNSFLRCGTAQAGLRPVGPITSPALSQVSSPCTALPPSRPLRTSLSPLVAASP